MRILVLGGSRQLGGAFITAAAARGHDLTVFNRGRTNPARHIDTPGRLRIVRGDRNHDLAALGDGSWDAVVDTSAYTPSAIQKSLAFLGPRVDRYLFVSTVMVYRASVIGDVDEAAPLLDWRERPQDEAVSLESYGFLKAHCEHLLRSTAVSSLIVRPGVMVGPEDHTARLKFWVDEVATQDDVIVPGKTERKIQVIDARDVADWMLDALERKLTGEYNVAGSTRTLREVLKECRTSLSRSHVRFHWLTPEEIAERTGLSASLWPLWNGGIDDRHDSGKALRAGLRYRSFGDTLQGVRAAALPSTFILSDADRARLLR